VSLVAIVAFMEQQIALDASLDTSVGMSLCMFVLTLSAIASPGKACTHCSKLNTVVKTLVFGEFVNSAKFFTNFSGDYMKH